jgi:aryl-alcohol dehydrogenase-like predicted oxidoreductase
MKHRPLGRTGLTVPEICLGSMTWGSQNTEAEAHAQMDHAFAEGVNFIDAAEMYPTTPISPDTQGLTEAHMGTWIRKRGRRDDLIIATKIAGMGLPHIDGGAPISAKRIGLAVERSLKRLQTDYIDLYQLHWPNRGHYHFRRYWGYTPSQQAKPCADDVAEILGALGDAVKAGKIRHIGLSNETAWGATRYLDHAEKTGLPRVATIQNEYSLLHRLYDSDLAELSHHEDVGLLAYSVLAMGLLTGKYENGAVPKGSRMAQQPTLGGRVSEHLQAPLAAYLALARKHGLEPAQMAIAFCLTRPFMASVIIGATSMEQLKVNLGATRITLPPELLTEIEAIHRRHPIPM